MNSDYFFVYGTLQNGLDNDMSKFLSEHAVLIGKGYFHGKLYRIFWFSEVVLTELDFSWEKMKYNVNEGPAVIKRKGKLFVTYSASATNHNYCIGLLSIDDDVNLLEASNWYKSPAPVFSTNEEVKRFGPGHNSFTTSEDGEKVILIYHARDYKEIIGNELSDPNRATRARVLEWTESGFPDFIQQSGD